MSETDHVVFILFGRLIRKKKLSRYKSFSDNQKTQPTENKKDTYPAKDIFILKPIPFHFQDPEDLSDYNRFSQITA